MVEGLVASSTPWGSKDVFSRRNSTRYKMTIKVSFAKSGDR